MKMTKVLGLAAIGTVLILAAPVERAQALSLANPATAAAVQESFHSYRPGGFSRSIPTRA